MVVSTTVLEGIQGMYESLTRAERQLANSLLDNYPVSGLSSITTVAQKADVSTPTVARMVQKLGFKGFPQFQEALRQELAAKISSPIEKYDSWAKSAPDSHVLNLFTEAVIQNLRQTLSQIDPDVFDSTCKLLADPNRAVGVVGGRITHSLAEYFFTHLQIIRSGTIHIPSNANAWTHYVLDMKPDDVLVIFDVRRYENDLLKLAAMAQERGVQIVLFTDQWGSPVSKLATHRFNSRIEVPSAWDSSVVTMLIIEAMVAAVQEQNWDQTKTRLNSLEGLFDQTRLFRKFV